MEFQHDSTGTTVNTLRTLTTSTLDRVGISASLLCAIHCAALPLLIGVLPVVGLGFLMHGVFEAVMIAIAAVVGGWSLGHSYRTHRLRTPLALLFAGIAVLLGNFAGHEIGTLAFERIHPFLAVAGGGMIVTGHVINIRYHSRHGECPADHLGAHSHEATANAAVDRVGTGL